MNGTAGREATLGRRAAAWRRVRALPLPLRNFAVLAATQGSVRVLSFGLGVYLARVLGVDNYGLYTYAFAFASYFLLVSDFGLSRYVVREVSRDPTTASRTVRRVVGTRYALASLAFAVMLALSLATGGGAGRTVVVCVAGLALLLAPLYGTLDAYFNAREAGYVMAAGQVISTVTAVASAGLAASLGAPVAVIALAVALSAAPAVVTYVLLARRDGVAWWPVLEPSAWRADLASSFPFFVLGFFAVIFFKIDSVMLTWYRGTADTGLYAAAYRLFEGVMILPAVILIVMFPRSARAHVEGTLRRTYVRVAAVLLLAAALLAPLLALAADPLVRLLYGSAYADAGPLLRVLAIALPLAFMDTANAIALYAHQRVRLAALLAPLTAGSNILMNLYFIPHYGPMGAAVTTVLSEVVSVAIFTPLAWRWTASCASS